MILYLSAIILYDTNMILYLDAIILYDTNMIPYYNAIILYDTNMILYLTHLSARRGSRRSLSSSTTSTLWRMAGSTIPRTLPLPSASPLARPTTTVRHNDDYK